MHIEGEALVRVARRYPVGKQDGIETNGGRLTVGHVEKQKGDRVRSRLCQILSDKLLVNDEERPRICGRRPTLIA